MKAENGKRVKVQFIGRLDDGTVFGEAPAEKPLDFTLGREGIIPGFNEALNGMEPGEKKTIHLSPEQGFGARDADKVAQPAGSAGADDARRKGRCGGCVRS